MRLVVRWALSNRLIAVFDLGCMKASPLIHLILCGLGVFANRSGGADTETDTTVFVITPAALETLFGSVRTNNTSLRAAEARFQQARTTIATVRDWEDPTVSLGGVVAGPRRGGLTQEGDLIYGVEQKLPLWDRPRLSRAIAVAESATQGAAVAQREQGLRAELTKALLRVALVGRNLHYLTNDLVWLDTHLLLQEARSRALAGSPSELLMLQNERSKRTDSILSERNRLRTEEASLNRLLNWALSLTWPPMRLPQLMPSYTNSTPLAAYAVTHEARAKVLRQEIAQARAVIRLTETDRLPTVSVGMGARQFSGDGGLREGMLSVNFNLPWLNAPKYRADIARATAKLRVVEADLADYELGLREEVLRLTLAAEATGRSAVLYRDEISQRLEQALALQLIKWETRQGQLRDVLDTRRTALEAQLMVERATAEQHLALADLAALCGLPDHFQLDRLLRSLGGPAQPQQEAVGPGNP